MPRFGIKSLLFVFVGVAIWMSTFRSYPAADDVRRSVMLVILLTALFRAVYSRERRRAFWSGFFIVMLISCLGWNLKQKFAYFPLGWGDLTHLIVRREPGNERLFEAVADTIGEAMNILLAIIVGSIAAYIYDQNHQTRLPKHR